MRRWVGLLGDTRRPRTRLGIQTARPLEPLHQDLESPAVPPEFYPVGDIARMAAPFAPYL
jgi:hypothetical protein